MPIDQVTAVIAAIGGLTGMWGLLTVKAKQSHERQLKIEARHAEFNDNLKDQVDNLNTKVDQLLSEKHELLTQMADIKAELAEARATIRHLEEVLRVRASDRR
jgi:peptidoglycan hydrolase CwlO-like protein